MNNQSVISQNVAKQAFARLFGAACRGLRGMGRAALALVLLTVAGAMFSAPSLAQTATIIGEVTDAGTGETLPGANVVIQGTTQGVATDIDGRYTLRRVPAGDHILDIRYMGYETRTIAVSVAAEERLTQDVQLVSDMIEGDEIFVVGYQRGQSRALTRQRQSTNIRSVISAEQIDRSTTTTVDGALSRVTGMHGGTNIRGVGNASSNITMDGQRMGTTGKGTRSVDLGTISVDMVSEMDVIKVITPDMDADALAGVINISTRRPVGGERDLNVRLGGGMNSRYSGDMGGNARASFSYGDSPSDKFAFAVNASYQRTPIGQEELVTDWHARSFQGIEGPRDVLSGLSTELRFDTRERYGTGLQLTFQPSDRTTFHVQGMFNYQQRERIQHSHVYEIDVLRYINPNETRPSGAQGSSDPEGRIRYEPRQYLYDIFQNTFQASARHLFDSFDLEYKIGWGHGRYYEDQLAPSFATRRPALFEWYVNMEDRFNPTIDLLFGSYPTANNYVMRHITNEFDKHVDNEFSGTIDLEVPYIRGSFKFGSSARMTFKKGDHETHEMDFYRELRLHTLDMIPNTNWHILGRDQHHTYYLPNILDMDRTRDFYLKQFPHFNLDLETWAQNRDRNSFNTNENTFAAYGMSTLELGRFRFLGGARVEHTYNLYEGKEAIMDASGNYRGSNPLRVTNGYTHLFPNAQLVYGLGSMTNVRLAYSRSIGRPTFRQLAPYREINYARETIRSGNPNLKPMVSDNLDVMFEHYFMNVGELTVGFFYKEMSDFVYAQERRRPMATDPGENGADPGDAGEVDEFAGWSERTFYNGEEANVYGVEVSWQQNLTFLPGLLGNLSTFANYSWTRSTAHMDRRSAQMTGQYPQIVNFGLDYHQGSFSASAFYRWSTDVLVAYGDLQFVPEIQTRERVYFDRYNIGRNDLSLSMRYRLTSNMRIWADLNNLLNQSGGDYFYDADYYPRTTRMTGRNVSLGLRYSL